MTRSRTFASQTPNEHTGSVNMVFPNNPKEERPRYSGSYSSSGKDAEAKVRDRLWGVVVVLPDREGAADEADAEEPEEDDFVEDELDDGEDVAEEYSGDVNDDSVGESDDGRPR